MPDVPIGLLFAILIGLLLLSGFFSGSETALMALNRYRLRHLVSQRHPGAVRSSTLLERPDRLIGLILLGNNFVNVLASSIATLIALQLWGEAGIALAAGFLTLALLVFGEVAPKTLAALYPERVAFPASYLLGPLLRALNPIVWGVNLLANGVLRIIGVRTDDTEGMALSREELRIVVREAGALIPRRHQQMLVAVLDLEQVTVEDVMVPRSDIVGIDVGVDAGDIANQLQACRHTRVPVYCGSIDEVIGILHVRQVPRLLRGEHAVTREGLEKLLLEPYFVPMGTPLHVQIGNFQREKRRLALIVDEYGFVQGLVTLEDILEEIVGKFTTDPQSLNRDIVPDANGSYLIDGTANLREINRSLHWQLPTTGPKTLNGLVLEALENIPERGTALRIAGYTIEIVQATENAVKTARVTPPAPSGQRLE